METTNLSDISQRPVVVTRFWHLALALIVYLLTVGFLYGSMRTQMDEERQRTEALERNKVDQKQFDEMRDDLFRRLDRIENKLDRRDDLRQVH